jgi:hypothetical protein
VEEVEFVLKKKQICDFLRLKYRVCIEDGIPDFSLLEADIP